MSPASEVQQVPGSWQKQICQNTIGILLLGGLLFSVYRSIGCLGHQFIHPGQGMEWISYARLHASSLQLHSNCPSTAGDKNCRHAHIPFRLSKACWSQSTPPIRCIAFAFFLDAYGKKYKSGFLNDITMTEGAKNNNLEKKASSIAVWLWYFFLLNNDSLMQPATLETKVYKKCF